MESQIEKVINQLTSSDLFLRTVATFINFNSYRKIILRHILEKILKDLELPVRRDQERLLALVQELEIRIKKMQLKDEAMSSLDSTLNESRLMPLRNRQKVIKNKKALPQKRMN